MNGIGRKDVEARRRAARLDKAAALPPPVVHVVDDDPSFRRAVSRLLRATGYHVRDYPSATEFLTAKPGHLPGCAVVDVQMPGPSGLELQRALAVMEEPLPVIFLTGHGDIAMSVTAMKCGAVDFLTKPLKREILLKAVQTALALDAEARRCRMQWRELHARYEQLSPREREVFGQVVAGRMNKQIAQELGTVERTVKAHRAQVMKKMKAASVAELVHLAEQMARTDKPRATAGS
jgi:FixJ family two-component response regulator